MLHAFQKEIHPRLPVARGADAVEEFVIRGAVFLQVEREVEERLGEQPAVVEQERDEEAAETAIAIEEGVDGLELDVGERGLQQEGQAAGVVMQELFQRAHARLNLLGRGRDEVGIAGAGAADPVLAAAELAGLFFIAAALRHEGGVHFAEETVREREAFANARHAVLQGGDVIGDFHHVVERHAWSLGQLKEQEVGEGRLRALDLRGEHGLAPDVRVEKKMRVRQQGADAVQPSNGECGALQKQLPGTGDFQGWHGRQWRRHKSTHLLAPFGRGVIGAGGGAVHGAKL